MGDFYRLNQTFFIAGLVVNLICMYVYGSLFVKPREMIIHVASDLTEFGGRGLITLAALLLVRPAYYFLRGTLGRFLIAACNFRVWGFETILGNWGLHFCILVILLVNQFSVSGFWHTAIPGLCLVPTIGLTIVLGGRTRTSAKVQNMSRRPTDDTVADVIALGRDALPVLLIVLEHADNNARTAAVYAVGQIGISTGPVIEALKVVSVTTDSILREAAEAALRSLSLPSGDHTDTTT